MFDLSESLWQILMFDELIFNDEDDEVEDCDEYEIYNLNGD